MKCIYLLENYVFVKTSVWDIFKSFICGHESLKGLGACPKSFLFTPSLYKQACKSFS